ncbi:MAG: acyl carrier protein [Alteromonadaceae bacterium]|nr:acyl carrier protein [Alteromonadaceae bacterium]
MSKEQQVINQLKPILSAIMPSYSQDFWKGETKLFGALSEFDSMAIVNLIGEIEDDFGIDLDDDDISAENFATLNAIASLIVQS